MLPKCNENDDLNEELAEECEGEEAGGLETCHAGCPHGNPFSAGCPNFAAGKTFFLTLISGSISGGYIGGKAKQYKILGKIEKSTVAL